MTLAFLNPARSFDEARQAVCFFGHDGMFEIRFFIEAAALAKGASAVSPPTESNCLAAFDTQRDSIQDVAREAYANHRLKSYTLSKADFR